MEEAVGATVSDRTKMELTDLVYNAGQFLMLWFLISLSNVRLISCWLIASMARCGLHSWHAGSAWLTTKLPDISLPGLPCVVRIWTKLSRIPGLLLDMFAKLYHSIRLIVLCCSMACQSLHSDAFCYQIRTSGACCITWMRRHWCNRHVCHHLYANISRLAHDGFHSCGATFHRHCPTLAAAVTRCATTVVHSTFAAYLGSATVAIHRVTAACLLRAWVLVARVYMSVAGCLFHQIHLLSQRLGQTETIDEAAGDVRASRICTGQGEAKPRPA